MQAFEIEQRDNVYYQRQRLLELGTLEALYFRTINTWQSLWMRIVRFALAKQ